jgi:hypothetical protein
MMSGHCAAPSPGSHERCQRNGGGSTANPAKEFSPCPCPCHFPGEQFDCECGGVLSLAPHWPNEWGDDDPVYTHLDRKTGRAIGEHCP